MRPSPIGGAGKALPNALGVPSLLAVLDRPRAGLRVVDARDGRMRAIARNAAALLAGSWLLGLNYFAPACPVAWAVLVAVAPGFVRRSAK